MTPAPREWSGGAKQRKRAARERREGGCKAAHLRLEGGAEGDIDADARVEADRVLHRLFARAENEVKS